MNLRDLVSDTLRTLWAHKVRSGLTMFGIAWGIVSITLMVAAGEGLRAGQAKVAEGLGKDLMIIHSGVTSMQAGGARAGRRLYWRSEDHLFLQREATDCGIIIPEIGQGGIPIRSSYNSASLMVDGAPPEFSYLRTIPIEAGRFYSHDDEIHARRVAFLGSDAKKQLFAGRDAIGETVHIGDFPYTVIGVMEFKEQDSSYDGRDVQKIFVPYRTAMRDFPNKPPLPADSVDRMLASPKSVEHHERCKSQIIRGLARLYNFDPRDKEAIYIWDTLESNKAFETMTNGMKTFLGLMGFTTLFLGGIGVMNVMLVAVRERTREIGVRMAVGATSGEILRQFFLEAMVLVVISGAIGFGVAYGICAAVNSIKMPMYFAGLLPTWKVTALSLAVLGVVAFFSALYPANRAATVDPIEALRFEAGG